jgi:hypothetical protein
VPLEGHWQRTNTPLRKLHPRERKVGIAAIAATVVALAALLLATGGDSRPGPAPGCVSTVVAGRVGGEPVNGCGAEALAICARAAAFDDPRGRKIVDACHEQGIPVRAGLAPATGRG